MVRRYLTEGNSVKNTNVLRETINAIISEAMGNSMNFEFPIHGDFDETFTVQGSYNPSRPFEVELWGAVGPDGEPVDVEELEARYNAKEVAWAYIEKLFDD